MSEIRKKNKIYDNICLSVNNCVLNITFHIKLRSKNYTYKKFKRGQVKTKFQLNVKKY